MTTRTKTAVIAFAILIGIVNAAHGQRTGSGGTIETPKPRPRTAEPTQKTGATVRIIKYVEKPVTPLTGRLYVEAETGAVILIEPLNIRNAQAEKAVVPDGRRGMFFNDLKPGNYRVAATLAGHREAEQPLVSIKRNENRIVTLNFEPIRYSVTINTNVDGELKYGKEGQVPSSRPVQNKTIKLQLTPGNYVFEVEPAEPVYKTEQRKVAVDEDMTLDIRLELAEFSKDTFRADWTATELKNWEVPASWRTSSGNLIVKGAGVALPRDETKRNYKDFEVISDAKVTNGLGVGFVLRAQDVRNYYLVEFTGAQADEPFYVRLFVVRNGIEQPRVQAIKIPNTAAAALRGGINFTAHLKVSDNRIDVKIEDNESGMIYSLGGLTDPNRTFTAGAPGVGARGSAESVVWRFFVCSANCPMN